MPAHFDVVLFRPRKDGVVDFLLGGRVRGPFHAVLQHDGVEIGQNELLVFTRGLALAVPERGGCDRRSPAKSVARHGERNLRAPHRIAFPIYDAHAQIRLAEAFDTLEGGLAPPIVVGPTAPEINRLPTDYGVDFGDCRVAVVFDAGVPNFDCARVVADVHLEIGAFCSEIARVVDTRDEAILFPVGCQYDFLIEELLVGRDGLLKEEGDRAFGWRARPNAKGEGVAAAYRLRVGRVKSRFPRVRWLGFYCQLHAASAHIVGGQGRHIHTIAAPATRKVGAGNERTHFERRLVRYDGGRKRMVGVFDAHPGERDFRVLRAQLQGDVGLAGCEISRRAANDFVVLPSWRKRQGVER